ncbi:MAG: rhomboid family intramembrane serine protease [bacterium]|nr:rhomboid family intramembrane serine protease [bacterium]
MQTQRSFLDELKVLYKQSTFMKLIFMNAIVFLLIQIALVFGRLAKMLPETEYYLSKIFAMPTGMMDFLYHPWTIVTSMFAHFGFLHILLNMIMLYFIGRIFEQVFDGKKLLYTYLLGGFAGGALEIIAHLVFAGLYGQYSSVVGASGAVMALFVLLGFGRPDLKVTLFIFPPVRLIWLALIYIAIDFFRLGTNDGVAHFAHLGGAIVGFIGSQNMYNSGNLINRFQRFSERFVGLFTRKERQRLKVKRGPEVRNMTDEEYNADAKARQKEIDRILDKISKSGYESLSKREKDFLFNQSKNG